MYSHIFSRFSLAAAALLFCSAAVAETLPDHYTVYLGTYSSANGSKGIYRTELKNGKLAEPELVAETRNASFLAIHPNKKWLYAINEIDSLKGKEAGAVTGFAIEKNGGLTLLNQESSVGPGPAHLAIDPSGKWVLVANYGGGSSALLPIGGDGKLGEATAFIKHEAVKPQVSHAHCATFSPDGRFAFICDAGVDKIHQFKLDNIKGGLIPNDPPFVQIGSGNGTGPRHFVFNQAGTHGYVINETNMTVTALSYAPATGVLKPVQTVSSLPSGTAVTKGFSTAEIAIHPSGKFVFGSNRGFDSIATFSIDLKSAELTQTSQQQEGIKVPRNFGIDPSGRYLLAANQDADSVVVFEINQETGALKPTGESIKLSKPVCVLFLAPAQ
ncbi:MAG: 3-carboxymuconate cyclase [Chthoniobacteraceae bacterium]|nr:3-carboxymuconate cyclase [Chthoniobacteraceae bacterium]